MSTAHARALRQSERFPEKLLWEALRGRRFEGLKFRRQVPFERYVADFVCLEARLVIELDGYWHSQNGEHDARRTAVIEAKGFQLIRFDNKDVVENLNVVLDRIRQEALIAGAIAPDQPAILNPLPEGEGGRGATG